MTSRTDAASSGDEREPRPWYLNSIVYAVQVCAFADANADGVGDLDGVVEHLDYLQDLGVDLVWLTPFYLSGNRDNGYDVVDHRHIDPMLGDEAAFERLVDGLRWRGMRLMVDLVAEHTSDQHPWFREARSSRTARHRGAYVWADEPPEHDADPVFPSPGASVWTYNQNSDDYYRHRFYPFEPGLATHHPEVMQENCDLLTWWLDRGASAIRVDAASHVVEAKGEPGGGSDDTPLRRIHATAQARPGDPVPLLGETDVEPKVYPTYLDGGGLDVLFDFFTSDETFLALARRSSGPLRRGLRRLPPPRPGGTYLHFLRNVDELDLERLTEEERAEVYDAFGPEANMRIWNWGIRRRLAPMLGGDRPRIELANAVTFALPGMPLLVYGDELGMGDDLRLPERWPVRTTMPWTDGPNGGFSEAGADAVLRPTRPDGQFGYRRVNVRSQAADPDSLLCWFRSLTRARRAAPEIGWARWRVLDVDDDAILAVDYRGDDERVLVVSNLADRPAECRLADDGPRPGAVLFEDARSPKEPPDAERDAAISLAPYGYRWYRWRT